MKSSGEFAEKEKWDDHIENPPLPYREVWSISACALIRKLTNMDKKLTLRYNTPKRGCFYADFAL